MTLYIGNPTNVVVAQAYSISFVKYSAWMLVPTIVSIILAYIFLRVVFRNPKFIPKHIDPPKRKPGEALNDKFGAIFGVILLGLCLITLMATSFTKIQVWVVTLPFAVASMARDIFRDLTNRGKERNDVQENNENENPNTKPNGGIDFSTDKTKVNDNDIDLESNSNEKFSKSDTKTENLAENLEIRESRLRCYTFKNTFPTIYSVLIRMPGNLLPFSIGMFILVEGKYLNNLNELSLSKKRKKRVN